MVAPFTTRDLAQRSIADVIFDLQERKNNKQKMNDNSSVVIPEWFTPDPDTTFVSYGSRSDPNYFYYFRTVNKKSFKKVLTTFYHF